MVDHLSVSQIGMFLRCPVQYEFRYLKGIKIPPAGAMIQGTAYHETLASDLIKRTRDDIVLSDDDVADIYSTSFDHQVHDRKSIEDEDTLEFEEIDWRDEEPGKVKDEGITLAKLYHNTMLDKLNPESIEDRRETGIAGIPFVFIADVVEKERVIDHKVKKRRFGEDELKRDLQATAYSMIYNRPLEFHQALKLKQPTIDIAYTLRTEGDYQFFTNLVSKVKQAIDSGIFYPNPTGWACSEQWCGYYNICKNKEV
uniref:Putative PD-(D/E)XK nuclease superfamily protein n=1 Tax=viral metagenome TaxID=1070528 RepID=A0A6M3KWU8_9ZZZZ